LEVLQPLGSAATLSENPIGLRSVTLRPALSNGLPFSNVSFIVSFTKKAFQIKLPFTFSNKHAMWQTHVRGPEAMETYIVITDGYKMLLVKHSEQKRPSVLCTRTRDKKRES